MQRQRSDFSQFSDHPKKIAFHHSASMASVASEGSKSRKNQDKQPTSVAAKLTYERHMKRKLDDLLIN